jgi:hypothetical protein
MGSAAADNRNLRQGPFRVPNLTIKPSATQTMTLAECQGTRVQAALTSLTVAVADGRNVKVDTTVNGKSASIFSSSGQYT